MAGDAALRDAAHVLRADIGQFPPPYFHDDYRWAAIMLIPKFVTNMDWF
jgi:hypothetical protein